MYNPSPDEVDESIKALDTSINPQDIKPQPNPDDNNPSPNPDDVDPNNTNDLPKPKPRQTAFQKFKVSIVSYGLLLCVTIISGIYICLNKNMIEMVAKESLR